jgi:hypothetical protein
MLFRATFLADILCWTYNQPLIGQRCVLTLIMVNLLLVDTD